MTRPRSFALAASTCLAAAALMAGPSGLGLSLSLLATPALAQTAEELEKQYGREAMWQALETKRRYDLYGVHFDVDKATIQPQSEPLLNDIAETMATFPTWGLQIIGHTDSTGDAARNEQLSQERADAVKAALIALGVASGRIEAEGVGQSQPVATNDTPVGRALNRRVQLVRLDAPPAAVGGPPDKVAKLPPSGTSHFTTYFSVHPAHELKMVDDSSITVAEFVGITRNPDGEPYFDNLVVRCLVTIRVVKGEQELYGACRETDQDGDYTSTTFDSKAHYFIGGTGKYKGITGTAPFTVQSLPSPDEGLGALVIPHEVTWKFE